MESWNFILQMGSVLDLAHCGSGFSFRPHSQVEYECESSLGRGKEESETFAHGSGEAREP